MVVFMQHHLIILTEFSLLLLDEQEKRRSHFKLAEILNLLMRELIPVWTCFSKSVIVLNVFFVASSQIVGCCFITVRVSRCVRGILDGSSHPWFLVME